MKIGRDVISGHKRENKVFRTKKSERYYADQYMLTLEKIRQANTYNQLISALSDYSYWNLILNRDIRRNTDVYYALKEINENSMDMAVQGRRTGNPSVKEIKRRFFERISLLDKRLRSGGKRKEKWKPFIDYAVRNIMTGDEEESRLLDDKQNWLEGWKEEGVSPSDLKKLKSLMAKLNEEAYARGTLDPVFDAILAILKPYVSHKKLFEEDYAKWEDRFFSRSPTIKERAMQVVDWAKKKYGKDALYMLKETHEGREVWGDRLTDAAIKLLKKER